MARLQDPALHDLGHWRLRSALQVAPEITPRSVAFRELLHIAAQPIAEGAMPQVMLQHAQHRAALGVRDLIKVLRDRQRSVGGLIDGVRVGQRIRFQDPIHAHGEIIPDVIVG